ncbi:uncharacterized protein LOC113211019 [Frankliniella occidentalis]|uniref:Uncharacterized protein LOC113211019 n=1 Tax=Frankliniella occidentalis TaxID=133901 RepID=A0A6J1SVV6_FRAOC|nr:uncharacterized protein LOC113211019 [Frankliniella occidentalis]
MALKLVDDVLLVVMQYLDVEDLFACRLVCKRLGALALHPDAWRHRRLTERPKPKRCYCAVLRLAPCLDAITYYSDKHTRAFVKTKCAVEDVHLDLGICGSAAEAGLVVRNQEALGRLKSVCLCSCVGAVDGDVLLSTIAASSALTSCRLTNPCLPATKRAVVRGPPRPSLQYFDCQLSRATQPFVNLLLAGHAATLQEVHMHHAGGASAKSAGLLAGMPKLHNLVCDLLPGLQAVGACRSLRNVTLLVRPYSPAAVRDAVKFLRRAAQLTTVVLGFAEDDPAEEDVPADFGVELLAALTRTLEGLSVIAHPSFSLRPLVLALPRLPCLTQLSVTHAPLTDDLLQGITPATAPALRSLQHRRLPDGEDCTHAWMHGPAVGAVLAANPSLHILVRDPAYCRRPSCRACAKGCHRELALGLNELALFGHTVGQCPSPEAHTDTRDTVPWRCLWARV